MSVLNVNANKRIYALDKHEISLVISAFDAQGEHYMDFRHAVNVFSSFRTISHDIQCRLLNKKDQQFEFMKMIYKDKPLDPEDVPDDHNMCDSDVVMVYCSYLFQRGLFHDIY